MRPSLPSLLAFVLVLLTANSLSAQSGTTREVGLRLTGLDNLGFIYKKGIAENTYRRYRLFSSSLVFLSNDAGSVGSVGIGAAIGKERRSPLADRLEFARGPEYGLSIGGTLSESATLVNISPRFGYVLGLLYTVNPQFNIGLETIPSISAIITVGDYSNYGFTAGFDSSAVALTASYRFYK